MSQSRERGREEPRRLVACGDPNCADCHPSKLPRPAYRRASWEQASMFQERGGPPIGKPHPKVVPIPGMGWFAYLEAVMEYEREHGFPGAGPPPPLADPPKAMWLPYKDPDDSGAEKE